MTATQTAKADTTQGAFYADAVTFGAEKVDKKLIEEFGKVKGKRVLAFDPSHQEDLTDYIQLYNELSNS